VAVGPKQRQVALSTVYMGPLCSQVVEDNYMCPRSLCKNHMCLAENLSKIGQRHLVRAPAVSVLVLVVAPVSAVSAPVESTNAPIAVAWLFLAADAPTAKAASLLNRNPLHGDLLWAPSFLLQGGLDAAPCSRNVRGQVKALDLIQLRVSLSTV